MDADFSIELGREDPILEFPWNDPAGKVAYVDLKRRPELLAGLEEAEKFPELREFLRTANSACSMVETAKCDAWTTTELSEEEEIYDGSQKVASYVDVIFSDIEARRSGSAEAESDQSFHQSSFRHASFRQLQPGCRQSFSDHEQFATKLTALLRLSPETPSAVEVCVRRCFFFEQGGVKNGFYCTLYVSGYGADLTSARQNWGVALRLMGNAIVHLSQGGVR